MRSSACAAVDGGFPWTTGFGGSLDRRRLSRCSTEIDGSVDEDDALLQQTREDVVGTLAPVGLLDQRPSGRRPAAAMPWEAAWPTHRVETAGRTNCIVS